MHISYESALIELQNAFRETTASRTQAKSEDLVLLTHSLGRVVARDVTSPISTPEFDTSAMDGFAISSNATKLASPEAPVFFQVHATIAAGDDPSVSLPEQNKVIDQIRLEPCVEIMTGARFPTGPPSKILDACVKVEDVLALTEDEYFSDRFPNVRIISVTKPIPKNANHRFAGEDIQRASVVLRSGEIINPYHLMPLASVGIKSLTVISKPRICVWSTGNELTSTVGHTRDVNSIFLTNAISNVGAEAHFLGIIEDDVNTMAREIHYAVSFLSPDILITSGGVSVGQFDCVRKALDLNDADIIFHGLSIRPGHPVLFALLPSPQGKVAFFGLPGNPGAAAACFKFLVEPYARLLLGRNPEQPRYARFQPINNGNAAPAAPRRSSCRSQGLDIFQPGFIQSTSTGESVVSVISNQTGPAKLSPFIHANCWIHLPRQFNGGEDIVSCYSMSSGNEI